MKSIHIERQKLPSRLGVEPTCPKCGMGNAMLHHSYELYQHDDTQCRDCGHLHLVRDHDPIVLLRGALHHLEWQLEQEQAIQRKARRALEETYCEADYERELES